MAKTRAQTLNIAIKKEGEDFKPTSGASSVTMTTRSKITKRKATIHKNDLPAQQVKVEEDIDTKPLLISVSSSSNSAPRLTISQEQINQLIHCIVNENMSVDEASRKANVCYSTGYNYYNVYKNDPEKRIPLPRVHTPKMYTQEQIGNLIRYINDDKMSISKASAKANMSKSSGRYYNYKFLKDPNHTIPVPRYNQLYTQIQKNEFIDYIINDKMSIVAASKKAKINEGTANCYYHNYFEVQNRDIPTPNHIVTRRRFTQVQIKEVISYIVDDKMSIAAASRKADFSAMSAGKYYRQYLKDNNMEIPVKREVTRCTQDQINKVIGYIVNGRMSIYAASKKTNMNRSTCAKFYRRYLNGCTLSHPLSKYTHDQINKLIGYIVDDKMTIREASKKANMHHNTGSKYYRRYLENQKRNGPT